MLGPSQECRTHALQSRSQALVGSTWTLRNRSSKAGTGDRQPLLREARSSSSEGNESAPGSQSVAQWEQPAMQEAR